MTRRPEFPKARHLALGCEPVSPLDLADGIVVSLTDAEEEARLRQAAEQAAAAAKAASSGGKSVKPAAEPEGLPRALAVDLSLPDGEGESCADAAGNTLALRCPSSTAGRLHAAERVRRAAQLGEAVLLEGLDRFWRLAPDGAGYCKSCGAAFVERLRESYGENFQSFDAIGALRAAKGPLASRPYGGLREALRLSEAVESGKRAALQARDEARRQRGLEIPVLGRVGTLTPPALLLCRHLDGLVFDLPSLDPGPCLLPMLAARAALGQRPAVAVAEASASEHQVRLLASLATACDVDLWLRPGASDAAVAALGAHRAYLSSMRERFRPAAPVADLVLLASPRADVWAGGAHLRAASIAATAIARLHLQLSVTLELPVAGRAPLVLACATGLREDEAIAVRRHVSDGGDVLLVGGCNVVDDEGRALDRVFPEAKEGMSRIGEGRVFSVPFEGEPVATAPLEAQIARAARELLGRGKGSLSLTGRGSVLARAYLDPERKLDVHLVNLDVRDGGALPAQGLTLHVAGQVAGGGRSGYWFAPDRMKGTEGERIALNPAGFGVSTVLPQLGAGALLTIPR